MTRASAVETQAPILAARVSVPQANLAMQHKYIDGSRHARAILAEVTAETKRLCAKIHRPPGLATLLVGDNPASHVYVNIKRKRARALGFRDFHQSFPVSISQNDFIAAVHACNDNPAIDGILIQLPLPLHIDPEIIIQALDPVKDVDGFHPHNVGRLFRAYTEDVMAPCTPAGIMALFRREKIALKGKRVVIIGRSNLVTRPLAVMLLQSSEPPFIGGDAATTVLHAEIPNCTSFTQQADIVIVAVGQSNFIKADMLRAGAIVIDVGINKVSSPFPASSASSIVGDVDFHDVLPKVAKITPVPGGVGPMTIALLMQNTLKIYKNRNNCPNRH